MSQRPVTTTVTVVCMLLLSGLSVAAGGLYLGVPVFTLDLTTTLTQLPVAVNAAFDELEATFIDLGVPPAELSVIRAQFDDALTGIEDFTSEFPAWVPVPLIGGGIEFGLPLRVIDGIRISGGLLSESLVRSISRMAGFEIPQPLADFDLDIGEYAGNVTADLEFSSWALSTEVVKRLDLLILALNLGVGLDLIGGEIVPQITYDLPAEMEDGVAAALNALHLNELAWSAFAAHGMIGFELGPPFLRLYGDVRWTMPLSQSDDWWGIQLGPVSALLGFVIRF
ncbi:MAG: hypothetical protein V3T03_03125 [Candidatus Bipolaricaulota bacterium]